jgi:hypothetical protein
MTYDVRRVNVHEACFRGVYRSRAMKPTLNASECHPSATRPGTEANRRSFLKAAGLAGVCACSLPSAIAATEQVAPAKEPLAKAWVATLLPLLAAGDRAQAAKAIRACSGPHYEALGLDATVGRFRGDLDGFLRHLQQEWGWVITRGPEPGVILIDENKPACVCPVVPKPHTGDLGLLCYCSEGIAERMFSQVVGRPVRATVVSSILRGNATCRYRIETAAGPATE